MCCVIWIKWVWWDHSRCYVLCDLNQVGVMGSQQVLCVVWFESSEHDGSTAGAMCCVSSGCDGITAAAVWFESNGYDRITAYESGEHGGMTAGTLCCVIWVRWMWGDHSRWWDRCVVWFESSCCDGITAGTMCCVIRVKWIWWNHSRYNVLCDLSQVDLMESQQVLCVVWFE